MMILGICKTQFDTFVQVWANSIANLVAQASEENLTIISIEKIVY